MKDGGPAFPGSAWTEEEHGVRIGTPVSGMSLRDYFAAKALVALWSNPTWVSEATKASRDFETMDQVMAKRAYSAADAMLAERDSETLTPPQGGYGG